MRSIYFIVDETTFPVTSFGPSAERNGNMGGGTRGNALSGPAIYVDVATATDMSLYQWNLDGTPKSGRIEFRDYDYEGSLKAIKFVDGICFSYSDRINPDSVMLPRIISLYIVPAKMTYEGY